MRYWLLEDGTVEGARQLLQDRALSHGLGVFETILAIDGALVRPERHFERMTEACLRLSIELPDFQSIRHAIEGALIFEGKGRARVRVMRTAGGGNLNRLAGDDAKTVLGVGFCPEPLTSIQVASSPWTRNEKSPLAGLKCSSYAENLFALDHARKNQVEELLWANTRGDLCEASAANVFLVDGATLITPELASGCLPGTARRRVIELAEAEGIQIEERRVPMDEVSASEEIFMSSATRGPIAVSEADGRVLQVGEMTQRLRSLFWGG